MKLLCHRGLWKQSDDKNTLSALILAIDNGLGIETDVRDCNGTLVISHDPPSNDKLVSLEELFFHYSKFNLNTCLALNIKSDGLQYKLLKLIEKYRIKNYFVFDMSIPDTLGYLKLTIPFAVRISEYEQDVKLLDQAEYVWLDAFGSEWYSIELIDSLLSKGKRVAIVSPELHKRTHFQFWSSLHPIASNESLYLCTDFVSEAMEFFNAKTN